MVSPEGRERKDSKQKRNAKASCGQYFVHELYLCAEMCMDRNYIGMDKLQPLFPYYILVALLKHKVNDDLKARLSSFGYLYVDRDPQAGVFLPRLTRTFSSLGDKDSGDLPVVPVEYINSFAILQTYI